MRTAIDPLGGLQPGRAPCSSPRATLEPATGRAARCRCGFASTGDTVTLENMTAVTVDTFAADAPRAPLVAYLARLRGRRGARAHTAADERAARVRAGRRRASPIIGAAARHRDDRSPSRRPSARRPHARSSCQRANRPARRARRARRAVTLASGRALLRAAIRATLDARARTPVRGVPREPRPGRRERDGLRLPHDEPAACRAGRSRRSPREPVVGRRPCSSSACSRPRSSAGARCGLGPDGGRASPRRAARGPSRA